MANPLRVVVVGALTLAVIACGKSPTSPSQPASLSGTWAGTGFFQPTSTLRVQITQSGSSLTGPWTSTQTISPPLGGGETLAGPSGTMTGSVNGSSVSMTFAISDVTPDCTFPIAVTGSVNASQMSGTYATANTACSLKLGGPITLTKQ